LCGRTDPEFEGVLLAAIEGMTDSDKAFLDERNIQVHVVHDDALIETVTGDPDKPMELRVSFFLATMAICDDGSAMITLFSYPIRETQPREKWGSSLDETIRNIIIHTIGQYCGVPK
jgi:hypothetical protein